MAHDDGSPELISQRPVLWEWTSILINQTRVDWLIFCPPQILLNHFHILFSTQLTSIYFEVQLAQDKILDFTLKTHFEDFHRRNAKLPKTLLPRLLLLWGLSLSALPTFPEAARMAELPLRCSPSEVTRGGGTEDGAAKIFGSDLGFTAKSFTWRVKPE